MRRLKNYPFERFTLVSEVVRRAGCECRWCGAKAEGRRALRRYGQEDPNGRVSWATGVYCSISCWRAFQ